MTPTPPDPDPILAAPAVREFLNRGRDAHKGDFGKVLLIAGSRGMSGAAALAGRACLRSGAGLVRVATANACLSIVAGFEPSYMTVGLPSDPEGRIGLGARERLAPHLEWADVIAIGPGLGRSTELDALAGWLYTDWPGPLVVDADALNALADSPPAGAGGVRMLTPHPGEFRRLAVGARLSDTQPGDEAARVLARRLNAFILLKGHRTLITDGQSQWRNTTGNPGMATGGSGDVLTGMTAAITGQLNPPVLALRFAAHVHGLAGDLAAAELGQTGLIASDLIRFLPQAWRRLEPGEGRADPEQAR